jgi:hypothetical protein
LFCCQNSTRCPLRIAFQYIRFRYVTIFLLHYLFTQYLILFKIFLFQFIEQKNQRRTQRHSVINSLIGFDRSRIFTSYKNQKTLSPFSWLKSLNISIQESSLKQGFKTIKKIFIASCWSLHFSIPNWWDDGIQKLCLSSW